MKVENLLEELLNDAIVTASNIMNPVWNGNSSQAYPLCNIACQLLDRCKVYSTEKWNNEPVKRQISWLRDKIDNIRRDRKSIFHSPEACLLLDRFIERWSNEIIEQEKELHKIH